MCGGGCPASRRHVFFSAARPFLYDKSLLYFFFFYISSLDGGRAKCQQFPRKWAVTCPSTCPLTCPLAYPLTCPLRTQVVGRGRFGGSARGSRSVSSRRSGSRGGGGPSGGDGDDDDAASQSSFGSCSVLDDPGTAEGGSPQASALRAKVPFRSAPSNTHAMGAMPHAAAL